MTMPTQEAQRSRQTAMQAERHWHMVRLMALADGWRETALRFGASDTVGAQTAAAWLERCAGQLDALIAERTK